ncbi:MAG: D-alanine--D-alanine ligase [Gammaproteobacteria bacterium]|nr:D-alanine--D-alanine ligase [Gammaproteobacteria bacterium]
MSFDWQLHPEQFGRVAVLLGGRSAERAISLLSGTAVLQALQSAGVAAEAVDPADGLSQLVEGGYDRVFNLLHGPGGEDGSIQGLLEWLELPATGSGVLASALAMDKLRTKLLWQSVGLPTAPYRVLEADSDGAAIVAELGLPLMVKPAGCGSSIGMTRVESVAELSAAWAAAAAYDNTVLVESWLTGDDCTVAIVDDVALPVVRVETARPFYDYIAKYESDTTRYHCPAGLEPELELRMQALAREAFDLLGCSGWGRVDLMLDDHLEPWLVEINTIPGMTDHSLVPMAAAAVGVDFQQLVLRILATTLAQPGQVIHG